MTDYLEKLYSRDGLCISLEQADDERYIIMNLIMVTYFSSRLQYSSRMTDYWCEVESMPSDFNDFRYRVEQ